ASLPAPISRRYLGGSPSLRTYLRLIRVDRIRYNVGRDKLARFSNSPIANGRRSAAKHSRTSMARSMARLFSGLAAMLTPFFACGRPSFIDRVTSDRIFWPLSLIVRSADLCNKVQVGSGAFAALT